jgi:DNA uptake protein ComE-like DNA-binding protein
MRPKLHYYLRFIFGLTRSEIYGFAFLLVLILAWFAITEFQDYQDDKELDAAFNPSYYESKLDSLLIKQQNFKKEFASKYPHYTYSNINRNLAFSKEVKNVRKASHQSLDINSADSLQWIALPGIGPAFAKRILAYREKLGGFYAVDQLKEVYGLDSTWVNAQMKNLHIGQGVYRKLSLQKTEWKDFRHPYLPYAQAKIFLSYRRQHPEMATFQDLDKIQLLDKNVWNKLKPYLEFNQ